MTDIDRLSIQVETRAENAARGIDSLVSSLRTLNRTVTSTNMGKLSNDLKTVSTSIGSFGRSMNTLSQAAQSLNNVNLSNLTAQAQTLNSLASALQPLGQASTGIKSFNTSIKNLDKTANVLPSIVEKINAIDLTKFSQQIKELNTLLAPFQANINALSSALNNLSKTSKTLPTSLSKSVKTLKSGSGASSGLFGGLFGGANMLANIYMIRRIGDAIGYLIEQSNAYVENLNLFNVAMGDNAEKAGAFVKSLEVLGVNISEATRYQATLYDTAKSLGMTADNAYTLSEQFTKLSYDYASLYNIPVDQAFEKLEAAVVGMSKPIRALGKDITEAKLTEIARSLGIQESVRTMSQAEKAELRFIAVMQQSTAAMNDMERTLESPANQLRILKAQFQSLTREIGNLFIPILTKTLPYIIAFVKAIRNMVNALAALIGVKLPKFDSSTSGINNLGSSMDSASESASKLQQQLAGFDEIEVIQQKSGGDGEDSGIGGGLGLNLEDYGYANILEDVKSKADALVPQMEKLLNVILAIGAAFAAFKFLTGLMSFVTLLKSSGASVLVAGLGKGFIALGSSIAAAFGVTSVSSLTAFAIALGAVAAVVATVYAGFKALQWGLSPAIQQMDVFAGVSEETKNKLEPVKDDLDDLGKTLNSMEWNNTIITDDDVENVRSKAKEVIDALTTELSADKTAALDNLNFLEGTMSDEQLAEMQNKLTTYYDDKIATVSSYEQQIVDIMNTYRDENNRLTQEGYDKIRDIQQKMQDEAITSMSANEMELAKLREAFRDNERNLNIEQAREILQDAAKARDEEIAIANDKYYQLILEAGKLKEAKLITEEQYNDMVSSAEQARDDAVQAANDQYQGVLDAALQKMPELATYLDLQTLEMRNKWEIRWNEIKTSVSNIWNEMINGWNTFWGNIGNIIHKKITEIKDKIINFVAELGRKGDELENNITTSWNNMWSGLWDTITSWVDKIKGKWDEFTGFLSDKWEGFKSGLANIGNALNPTNWFRSAAPQTQSVMAFASGGFVPRNASFVPPTSLWTAGEAGREVVGKFKGQNTVMPLENTGFIEAIYNAVLKAMEQAGGNGNNVGKVYLDGRELHRSYVTISKEMDKSKGK